MCVGECREEECVGVWGVWGEGMCGVSRGGGMCVGECGEEGCVWVSAGRGMCVGEEGCVGVWGGGCVWVCRGRKRRLSVCVCVACRRAYLHVCVWRKGVGLGGITHS